MLGRRLLIALLKPELEEPGEVVVVAVLKFESLEDLEIASFRVISAAGEKSFRCLCALFLIQEVPQQSASNVRKHVAFRVLNPLSSS